jgi:hypothetical protein
VDTVAIRNRGLSWHEAAAEAKAIAERTHDANAKRTLLEIAERYEALATFAECEAKKDRGADSDGL